MARSLSLAELFEGRHFDREINLLCLQWYLRLKLSLLELVEMMADGGISMAHTTIMRWVHHYAPEFERCWNRLELWGAGVRLETEYERYPTPDPTPRSMLRCNGHPELPAPKMLGSACLVRRS